jgi:hydroxymethylpyrimidine pyrophosphatase-like HAD family hydrolase
VLVVRPPASDKGTGIARLAELHGCTVDDVVAIGDWLNDVPMFRVAGRSFAVPGCPDVLAAVATDRLVAAGGQGAVAEAIGRVWG